MELPALLRQDLGNLVALQIPWAIRQLRYLADLPPGERGPAWRETWARATPPRKGSLITYLNVVLQRHALSRFVLEGRATPAEFSDWYASVKDQLEELVGQATLPLKVSQAVERVAAGNTTLSLDQRGVDPELWARQVADIRATMRAFAGRPDNGNFATILNAALISQGLSYIQAGRKADAIAAFDEAITLADERRDLPQVITGCNMLASLYSQGAYDINKALQRVLPLWERYQRAPPSLDLAQLANTLATAYARVGDPVETNQFRENAADLLTACDFPLPVAEDLPSILRQWTNAASKRVAVAPNHYVDFLSALSIWLDNLRQEQQFTTDPAHWKDIQSRDLEVQTALHLVRTTFNEQIRRDNELMRAMQGAYEYDPVDPAPPSQPFATDDPESIDARLARREFSEQLVQEIKAEFDKPEVQRYPLLRMRNLWRLGACQHGLGRSDLAARLLRQAYHLAEEAGGLDDVLQAIHQRINVLPPTEARAILDLCLTGIAKAELARAKVITPYQQSAFFYGRTQLYGMAMAWAREIGEWNTVLGVGDLLKARNFTLPQTDAVALDKLRNTLAMHYQNLLTCPEHDRPDLLRQRQLSYDNWLLEHCGEAAGWAAGLNVQELRESLLPGEAALSFYQLHAEAWLVVLLRKDGLIQKVLPTRPGELAGWLERIAELGNSGGAYRARGMGPYQGKVMPRVYLHREITPEAALRELGLFFLPDEVRGALTGIDHLYICPHRMLHRVPFHAVPIGEEYLIQRHAVSYLPNLRSLLYKDVEFSRQRGAVIVGSGVFQQSNGTALANLSGAREEVEELTLSYRSAGLPVAAFLELGATREALLAAAASGSLAGYDVLHIALHGEDVPTDSPLDARLFVHDGSLDGFDISHWQLSAELVVLSACFAGVRAVAGRGLAYLPGDDVFGLQAAFFAAGARRVFGALWPVADEVGKKLMLEFHRKLEELQPAQAWQQTVRAHLAAAPAAERGLAFWAPFFLVEEGRESPGR